MEKLDSTGCVQTIFVTEKAKIIAVATCLRVEETIYLTSENPIGEWLEKYIIMEDLVVEEVNFKSVLIIGKSAPDVIRRYFRQDSISAASVYCASNKESTSIGYSQNDWGLPGFILLYQGTLPPSLRPKLNEGATEVLETIRIESGISSGRDVHDINPLEAGLESLVSFTKGCYIGQEVIARLDTYQKVQKKFTGFIFERRPIAPAGKIFSGETEVGWITSSCWSWKLNRQIALGYLRTQAEKDGLSFRGSASAERVGVRAHSLPF
jgi:folate-binding protein YgfZ